MAAWGSLRRRFEWGLILGGVALACGGKTTSHTDAVTSLGGGATSVSGGTAGTATGGSNPSDGAAIGGTTTGGTGDPTGGTANPSGGTSSGGGSVGGTNSGGTSSGGSATGGATTACDGSPVSSLPAMATACSTQDESRCDASGNRCICERGIWYCNHACPVSQPTVATACEKGAFCSYAPGVTCACIGLPSSSGEIPAPDAAPPPDPLPQWLCIGTSSCPAALPMTGDVCTGLTDVVCDYPNTIPAYHMACVCSANGGAGSGSSWTCFQSTSCPATQPAYGLAQTCVGPAVCTYSTPPYHCGCASAGGVASWICL
jgi:hypothetical protein